MHKHLTTISAIALLASSFAAGAQEGEITSAPDISAISSARHVCCLHGPYIGGGLGFAHAKWEPKPEINGLKDPKKGGVNISLFAGYLHCFPSGFTVGGEGRVDFYPSIKQESGGKELKLDVFSPGIAAVLGYNCPQIKGMVGFTVGGAYSKTKTKLALGAGGATVEKDFGSFGPEIGLFYACKLYKGFGLRLDFRYAFGVKKEETINATKLEIKTDRMLFTVNAFYNISL